MRSVLRTHHAWINLKRRRHSSATVKLVDESLLPSSGVLATINRNIQADMRTLNSWGSMEKTADTFEQAVYRVDTVLRIIYRHCSRIIINPEYDQLKKMGDVVQEIDTMLVNAFKTGDYSDILRIGTSGQFSRPGPCGNATPEAFRNPISSPPVVDDAPIVRKGTSS